MISKSALVQKKRELQDKSKVLERDKQEKDSLQANLFDCMARLVYEKNRNQNLEQEKLETEALSSKMQPELKHSLSQQKRLFESIQKLEVEVFETNIEGISTLFEDTQQFF